MEATFSSETSINYHQATGRYIPEGRSVQFNWKTEAQKRDGWRKYFRAGQDTRRVVVPIIIIIIIIIITVQFDRYLPNFGETNCVHLQGRSVFRVSRW
jgi:hypothetical protein